jgi:MraZ protein
MPDFSNQYNATVDDKGRVVLPSAFKKEMGDVFEKVFAVELDPYERCLNIYPLSSWEKRLALVKARLNPNDPKQSKVLDMFYQRFVKIEMSENGRLNIPNNFLAKMDIKKDVVFTGQGERIRLWDGEEFRKSMLGEEDYSELFKEFVGGSLSGF